MTDPNIIPRSNIRTVQFCKRCGKPLGNQGVSSLTSWLFQETFCRCQLQDSASKGKSSELQPGSLFGNSPGDKDIFDLPSFGDEYEVLERIGRGGMGCVYKVRDVNLDRVLAVKVLHDQLKDDQQSVSRFEREAKAALKLMHANLVPVFAYDTSPAGAPYLVMDFVDGVSLDVKLKQESYLDVSAAIEIFLQICGALTHAHQHGIIHRDLKPGNIIITKDENGKDVAKLVDFGIAKVRSGSSRETQNLTQTGEVFGSPHYMSPEQCLGFDLDSRSDIYSLGCVMYECLSGKPPFEGQNAVQLVAKHLSADIPPLRICDNSQGGAINDRITEIIAKCLEKEPGDRYFSAELLASELRMLTEEVSVSSISAFGFPRKLSSLRILFLIFCCVSIFSIIFIHSPAQKEFLVFFPAVAALIGAVLVNGRLNEFVSRTQFQSKLIRDSACGSVNVLVICHWILAVSAAAAISSPFLRMMPPVYPLCSAALGAVIAVTVWAGFMQSVETSDIKGNIQMGKVMNAISIAMLATTFLFVSQYCGQIPSGSTYQSRFGETSQTVMVQRIARENKNERDTLLDKKDADEARDLAFEMALRDKNKLPKEEQVAKYVKEKGGSYWSFNIPAEIDLGTFYPLSDHSAPGMKASGKIAIPGESDWGLNFRANMAYAHANMLSRFPPDSMKGLRIEALTLPLARTNDAMYFIRNWKSLTELAVLGGDLNDDGLQYVGRFDKLKSLSLQNNSVTTAALCALPQLSQLRSLILAKFPDGSSFQNSHKIIKALRHSSALLSFGIMHSDIDNNDLKELARFPKLQYLVLDYATGVSDDGVKVLCQNSKLRYLSLVGAKITAKSITYIEKLHNLEHLILSESFLTDELRRELLSKMPKLSINTRIRADQF